MAQGRKVKPTALKILEGLINYELWNLIQSPALEQKLRRTQVLSGQ